MTRWVYRFLLWIHPPAFRQQFAGQMLSVFDEAAECEGRAWLILDNLISLGRQWMMRSNWWKIALACVFGLLQILAGGLGWPLHIGTVSGPQMSIGGNKEAATDLIRIMILAVAGIMLMVITLVIWAGNFNRRRT